MTSPGYPRRPVPSSLLRRTEYVGLQERMARDTQRLGATSVRDDDAASLEQPDPGGGITGTTGYESLLEAPAASDPAGAGSEADSAERTFSGPSARRSQLMQLPQLEMPGDEDLTSRRSAAPGYQGVDFPEAPDSGGPDPAWSVQAPGGTPRAAGGTAAPGEPPTPGGDLRAYARAVATRRGVDPEIFVRQIQQESGFDPRAVSPAGAQGVAQFMPATAKGVGLADPFEPYAALDAAARHMRDNLDANAGDYARALAAYNAGQGAVNAHGGVPPYEETRRYVAAILGDARPTAGPRPTAAPAAGAAPPYGTYAGEGGGGLVLNQFTQAQAEGLPPSVAMGICGPTAALAFAKVNDGRMPTLSEARELATRLGLYSDDTGMKGPTAESKLLDALGVPHTLAQGADEAAIARDVGAGRPVIVDTSGHYFAIEPGSYDAATRTFDFGGSAAALKASRGRTRYRLDEIASLGMGAPRSTFFLGTGR